MDASVDLIAARASSFVARKPQPRSVADPFLARSHFVGAPRFPAIHAAPKYRVVHRPWLASGPKRQRYVDGALRSTAPNKLDNFVEVFADKVPKTHGALAQTALSS